MCIKYRGIKLDGLTNKQWQQTCADWSEMIVTKREDDQVRRLWRPRSILKTPNPRYLLVPCPAQAPRVTLPGQLKLIAPSKPQQQLLLIPCPKENIVVPRTPTQRRERRKKKLSHQQAVCRGEIAPLQVHSVPPPIESTADHVYQVPWDQT